MGTDNNNYVDRIIVVLLDVSTVFKSNVFTVVAMKATVYIYIYIYISGCVRLARQTNRTRSRVQLSSRLRCLVPVHIHYIMGV
jgi:hypothetical protein